MNQIEKQTINDYLIPSLILMENAGLNVFHHIMKIMKPNQSVLILCGTGNNGGDGFVIARHLILNKIEATIAILDETKISGDALINFRILKKLNANIIELSKTKLEQLEILIKTSDYIVDAMFGTGLKRNIDGYIKSILELVNESNKYIISIDIPSGICSNKGIVMGYAINATDTITFGFMKLGHLIYPGKAYCGNVYVTDICIPNSINVNNLTDYYIDSEIKSLLPQRGIRSNKGTFGRAYIFCGCASMTGAAMLVSKAAYKIGAGLVCGCFTNDVCNVLKPNLIEAVYKIVPDKDGFYCKESFEVLQHDTDFAAYALGSGIGVNQNTKQFTELVLKNFKKPGIIDADALNIISENLSLLEHSDNLIITPHPKEMSRLTGLTVTQILNDPLQCAIDFSKKYNVVVVLKDTSTIVASPDGRTFINTTGNNSLAKGGTGDVLTGIITGLVASGLDLYTAATVAVYIHGRAADFAMRDISNYSLLASQLINYMDVTLKNLTS